MQLFKFKGGVKPDPQKTPSLQTPLGLAPVPALLVVPLPACAMRFIQHNRLHAFME